MHSTTADTQRIAVIATLAKIASGIPLDEILKLTVQAARVRSEVERVRPA